MSTPQKPKGKPSLKMLANPYETLYAFLILGLAYFLWWAGKRWYDEEWYIADEGLGYWLGLIGGLMMLLAYFYSARKHFKSLRFSGILKRWLNIHIYLGIIGPYLVIFHSTFRLESLNATMAFYAMILVMGSGVVGRFLYSHVHLGLSGHKVRFKEVQKLLGLEEGQNRSILASIPGLREQLLAYEKQVIQRKEGVISSVFRLFSITSSTRRFFRRIKGQLPKFLMPLAQQQGWTHKEMRAASRQTTKLLDEYLRALATVARFNIYDQLFTLWRFVHVPLLFLLLISGIVHVLYVHMY